MPGNVDYKILGGDFFFLRMFSLDHAHTPSVLATGFPTAVFMKASTTLFVFNGNIFAGKKSISVILTMRKVSGHFHFYLSL